MGARGWEHATFEWLEDWTSPLPDALGGAGWAHHDVVVTADQHVISFQSGGGFIQVFDQGGRVVRHWGSGLVEAHGMTITWTDGSERLWIADPGTKMVPDENGAYSPSVVGRHGRVNQFTLEGDRLMELPTPPHASYRSGRCSPTAVAVAGGNFEDGSIWVADGYGESLVHRFSADGEYELTLTGEEGAGRFKCPHAILIDHREGTPRLYVADRGNARMQVYDLEGRFLRAVSDGLRSPSAMATLGDELIVAELHARLAVLDRNDRVVRYLGDDPQAPDRPGWPNAALDGGAVARPSDLRPGAFNSPHGLAVDVHGAIYVAEWMVGGRMVRLQPSDGVDPAGTG